MGLIRIRMDQEILPVSGSVSGTRKIQSWIRIRNISFRIHNTGLNCVCVCTAHQYGQYRYLLRCCGAGIISFGSYCTDTFRIDFAHLATFINWTE